MDIALLNENSLRVKGKTASFAVDPSSSTPKTQAEAILNLIKSADFSDKKIDESRITINGAGEYEVNGVKISANRVDAELIATLDIDGVTVIIGSGSSIEKFQDKAVKCNVLVVNTNNPFNQSILTNMEPNVIVLYGARKDEVQKLLGKEPNLTGPKFSMTPDKLTEELQLVVLG